MTRTRVVVPRFAGVAFRVVLTLAFGSGCGDRGAAPTAPRAVQRPVFDVTEDGPTWVHGLARSAPIPQSSVTFTVSVERGGRAELPGTGMSLRVPPGAVRRDVAITMTALAGDMLAYEFEPHGLRFAVPVVLEQRLSATDAATDEDLVSRIVGAYFSDRRMLASHASGLSRVDEFAPTEVGEESGKAVIQLRHFSGYIVALGDAPAPADTTVTY
ncbi:MAG: hypothetical protein NVS9B3_01000 [Gemmatimonadaceae bacterium]